MPKIEKVAVEDIFPNPFRDVENYPFDEAKLERLKDSIKQTGAWPNIVVREADRGWELAYGHHRVKAIRDLGIKELVVVVEQLSDDQMLQMMANENSEEYGHDFALGVMNAVEAVVKAYAEGKATLPTEVGGSKGGAVRLRVAPGFLPAENLKEDFRYYSSLSVARYLGWVKADASQPAERVQTALAALELIERGVLKRSQLRNLGSAQARELVTLTQRKMKAEAEKAAVQREAVAKAAQAAAKAGDKPRLEKLERELEKVDLKVKEHVVNAGKAAAATVQQYFKESKSMAPAIERAAAELGVEKKAKPAVSVPKRLDLEAVDRFAARLDAMLLEEDNSWKRIIEMSGETRAKKAFFNLVESLEQLATRAKARAKELGKELS